MSKSPSIYIDCLIRGYVRSCSQIAMIPMDLVALIINYYWILEAFDIDMLIVKGDRDSFQISGEYNDTATTASVGYSRETIIGTNVIYRGQHYWKFKIIYNHGMMMPGAPIFGICKSCICSTITNKRCDSLGNAYCFVCSENDSGSYKSSGLKKGPRDGKYGPFIKALNHPIHSSHPKPNDEIEMFLDLDKKRIGFAVNGDYFGDAYSDINNDDEYKMVLTMGGTQQIQLIEYRSFLKQSDTEREVKPLPQINKKNNCKIM
eukprot:387081_1